MPSIVFSIVAKINYGYPCKLRRKQILLKHLVQPTDHMDDANLLETWPGLAPAQLPPHRLVLLLARLAARLGPRPLHLVQGLRPGLVLLLRLPHKLPPRVPEAPVPPAPPLQPVRVLVDDARRRRVEGHGAALGRREVPVEAAGPDAGDGHLHAWRRELGGAVQRRQADLVVGSFLGLKHVEGLAVFGWGLDLQVVNVALQEGGLAGPVDVVRLVWEGGVERGSVERDGVLEEVLHCRVDGRVGVSCLVFEIFGKPQFLLQR